MEIGTIGYHIDDILEEKCEAFRISNDREKRKEIEIKLESKVHKILNNNNNNITIFS